MGNLEAVGNPVRRLWEPCRHKPETGTTNTTKAPGRGWAGAFERVVPKDQAFFAFFGSASSVVFVSFSKSSVVRWVSFLSFSISASEAWRP